MNEEIAHQPEQSVMDVLDRAMAMFGATADRILVVAVEKDGTSMHQVSNARSAAEHQGILRLAAEM